MHRDLILRARNGDHDAFTALAADAFDRLHRTARLILRSDDLAADAVQEALVSAWIHIRAVRDPDHFDGWLHRLVVRACYHEARRNRTHGLVKIRMTTLGAKAEPDAAGLTADQDQLERGFRRECSDRRDHARLPAATARTIGASLATQSRLTVPSALGLGVADTMW
jgi:DNA-directed RNA polymerase specialized sigma24 family protein